MEETYNYIKDGNVKYIIYDDLNNEKNKNKLQKLIFESYTKKDSIIIMEQNQLTENPREIVLYELKK